MNIKEVYFYLFYKFYKFGEWSPSVFPSDWTAALAIDILELLLIASLKFYYIEYVDPSNELTPIQVIIVAIVVFVLNSIIFTMNDKWKSYVKKFDKLPRYKNIIGTWVVILIVAFILINVAISFNTMGQIAVHRHK